MNLLDNFIVNAPMNSSQVIKNAKPVKLWDMLQSRRWFLTSLMAVAGMLLALVRLALDQTDAKGLER
jgi:uncharacterized membrane protein